MRPPWCFRSTREAGVLEVESVRVDVSRVGRVLDDVTISAEPGVTVVTGRSGCGSTTLL
ncbi:MAG: hypothetical protein ACYDG3_12805, partial [Bacillati bacterium]